MKKVILAVATMGLFTIAATAQNKLGSQNPTGQPQQQPINEPIRTQDNGTMSNSRDILDQQNKNYNNSTIIRTDTLNRSNNKNWDRNTNTTQPSGTNPVR